jgi:hypothetical protein
MWTSAPGLLDHIRYLEVSGLLGEDDVSDQFSFGGKVAKTTYYQILKCADMPSFQTTTNYMLWGTVTVIWQLIWSEEKD